METKYVRVPFEVELAKEISNGSKEGRVVIRDGRSVRVVCWDAHRDDNIVALVEDSNGEESIYTYVSDGKLFLNQEHSLDLMLEIPEYMTFKDGDIIGFGKNHVGIFKSLQLENKTFSSYVTLVGDALSFYEPAWILTNAHIANEDETKRLIFAMKECDYPQSEEYLNRFFPNHSNSLNIGKDCEFKPFDKVLVRESNDGRWYADFFSNMYGDRYNCIGCTWKYCIPYNEQTAHLLGTTENYE